MSFTQGYCMMMVELLAQLYRECPPLVNWVTYLLLGVRLPLLGVLITPSPQISHSSNANFSPAQAAHPGAQPGAQPAAQDANRMAATEYSSVPTEDAATPIDWFALLLVAVYLAMKVFFHFLAIEEISYYRNPLNAQSPLTHLMCIILINFLSN